MKLYLYSNFNNYYNRKLKRYTTISAYGTPMTTITGISNFPYADGVNTQFPTQYSTVFSKEPDYAVLTDDNSSIHSRWYIIDTDYLRNGQIMLTMRRDLPADSWDTLKDAPMFVEKATLDASDNGIFNVENMSFTQKKIGEQLLADSTNIPWVIAYLSRDAFPEQHLAAEIPVGYIYKTYQSNSARPFLDITSDNMVPYDYEQAGITVWCNYLKTLNTGIPTNSRRRVRTKSASSTGYVENYGNNSPVTVIGNSSTPLSSFETTIKNEFANAYQPEWTNQIRQDKHLFISDADKDIVRQMRELDGKYIKTYEEGKVYQFHVIEATETVEIKVPVDSKIFQTLNDVVEDWKTRYPYRESDANSCGVRGLADSNTFTVSTTIKYVYGQYETVAISTDILCNIPNTRNRPDVPYSIAVMPYGPLTVDGVSMPNAKIFSSSVAAALAEKFGGEAAMCYDIQIVPYCPLSSLTLGELDKDYSIIKDSALSTQTRSVIFWAKTGQGTKTITQSFSTTLTNSDLKEGSNTKIYRICAPNYNGNYEFNPYMNRDQTDITYNVSFTYKPYNSSIRVCPQWNDGGLYSNDEYDLDGKGLFFSGSFAFPQISDAFATYERQNANYQNQFNRQIESQDNTNKIQRRQDIANAITGGISGASIGVAAGGKFGPVGGVAGGVLGGAAATVGGLLDAKYNRELRNEALDLTKDMFSYQIGNIKALPDSITNVGAYDQTNKIWPFVEIYSCIDIELTALRNKIKYNGMTVDRIGKIADFMSNTYDTNTHNYTKGKLIQFEEDGCDFHYVNSLADELNKGLYIPVGGV